MDEESKKESKLIEYQREIAKDSEVDRITIDEKSLKLPAYKAKWIARLMNHKTDLDELNEAYDSAIEQISEKIIADSPIALNKVTAAKKAEDHELVKRIKKAIKETQRIIEYLEKTEKQLSSMSFDIKNAIDVIRMETT